MQRFGKLVSKNEHEQQGSEKKTRAYHARQPPDRAVVYVDFPMSGFGPSKNAFRIQYRPETNRREADGSER